MRTGTPQCAKAHNGTEPVTWCNSTAPAILYPKVGSLHSPGRLPTVNSGQCGPGRNRVAGLRASRDGSGSAQRLVPDPDTWRFPEEDHLDEVGWCCAWWLASDVHLADDEVIVHRDNRRPGTARLKVGVRAVVAELYVPAALNVCTRRELISQPATGRSTVRRPTTLPVVVNQSGPFPSFCSSVTMVSAMERPRLTACRQIVEIVVLDGIPGGTQGLNTAASKGLDVCELLGARAGAVEGPPGD